MTNILKNAELQQSCITAVISRFSISDTLDLIKDQTGLGNQRTSESVEYDLLKRFADKYNLISIEPNGLRRVSVFQNGL